MKSNFLPKIFVILIIVSYFIIVSCDNNTTGGAEIVGATNEDNNSQGNNDPNNGNTPTNDNSETGTGTGTNNQLNLLKGTIWYADSGSLFIEFPNDHLNRILFRNYQYFGSMGGNLNGNVTLGNFRMTMYNGETIKLLDYNENEVAFTAIIIDNKLTVSELNAIRWTAPPFERRDYSSYNRTYTKGE